MRYAFVWTMLLVSGFGLHPASAQQSSGARPPMPAVLTGGQDLSSLDYEKPARLRPPEAIEADRARRAQRQAHFHRNYPGTPSAGYAALANPRRRLQ